MTQGETLKLIEEDLNALMKFCNSNLEARNRINRIKYLVQKSQEDVLKVIEENKAISESLESKNEYSTLIMNEFFRMVCEEVSKQTGETKQEVCDSFWAFLAEYRCKCFDELKSMLQSSHQPKEEKI